MHPLGRRIKAIPITIAKLGMVWLTVLAVAMGTVLPVVAADLPNDRREGNPVFVLPGRTDFGRDGLHGGDVVKNQMAQFQLPKGGDGEKAAEIQLPKRLTYQYTIGTESDITYRRDRDLDKGRRDNSLILSPQLNGIVIYRPTDWLETTLEMIVEREIPAEEEGSITLPSGETVFPPKRRLSLLIDQAFVTIKGFTAPFEFHAGRRNYEDQRHWLYDTSLDIASITFRKGHIRAEAFAGREVLWDLDLLINEAKDRINTYMFFAEYFGIEDIKLAAFTVLRNDRAGKEGRPFIMGLSSHGMPNANISYWALLANMRGHDEARRDFFAHAFDVGGTLRLTGLPLHPNITVGYAFATGDSNPNDNRNNEFRQTGLQSNEARFAGISDFKVYGETLDPELSNIKIFTAGLGFHLAPAVLVDLVFHRYWLDEIADENRNWALTAQMNQDDSQLSRDMGKAFDIVIGFRRMFGLPRLGLDLRMGWFFPGKGFRNEQGDPDNPTFRNADKASSIVAKFWW